MSDTSTDGTDRHIAEARSFTLGIAAGGCLSIGVVAAITGYFIGGVVAMFSLAGVVWLYHTEPHRSINADTDRALAKTTVLVWLVVVVLFVGMLSTLAILPGGIA